MTVEPGSRLGPYEIVSRVGAGGMGEVFRARDNRLERNVAIKVLPPALAGDAQFRLRLEREAKTVSQLNHPHICQIYDVGESSEGFGSFLVMELLEGETLADRLARGPLPFSDVLRYGAQIAEGLVAAHRAGIVHRDLKPGNIMLTKSGAKLLDFGLAKSGTTSPSALVSGTAFSGATEHRPLTQEGTIIGTFQYMAPEQLEGHDADARTDIFAFGAVLYEMVTGKRAFQGKTKTSLIAAIVDRDPPPITQFQPLTPPAFERVVRTCLEKDPNDRWQTAHDLLLQLRWIDEAGSQAGVAAPIVVRRKNRERLAWALALVLLAATAALGFLWRQSAGQPVRRYELSILPPDKGNFEFGRGGLALAPNGQQLVYIATVEGKTQLWLRRFGRGSAQPINGTDNASYPFWSPDSRYVGFFAFGKLKKIDTIGGPPQNLCDAANGRGGTWSREGVILFAPSDRDPIHRVSASGGQSVAVTELGSSEYTHRWPSFLPDGKHYLFLAQTATTAQERGRIYISTLGAKTRKEILTTNSPVLYSTSGHLVFVREQSLLAQRFDAETFELLGDAFPVADRVQYFGNTAWATVSVDAHGTIAYQATTANAVSQLVWFDRGGKPLGTLSTVGELTNPRLSRKGDRVAYEILDSDAGTSDIWIYDLTRNIPTRFTFEPARENTAVWTPDDATIIYSSEVPNRTSRNVVRKVSTGAGREELLFTGDAAVLTTVDISPDQRFLTFNRVQFKSRTMNDLWIFSFAERKATPFLQTRFQDLGGFFSPDGKWLAYVSDESDAREVYVQPFPPNGAKWQISSNGGRAPRWRRDGKELFFFDNDTKLWSAAVTSTGDSFSVGVPQVLFDTRMVGGYDVTADGQRFLINQRVREDVPAPLTVVLNWTAELEK